MLKTIEEKLSAIRAINEEKERVESYLSDCAASSREVITDITKVIINTGGDMYVFETVPVAVVSKIHDTLTTYFTNRRQELIAMAEELMK